jgi:vitamin B12 transporter
MSFLLFRPRAATLPLALAAVFSAGAQTPHSGRPLKETVVTATRTATRADELVSDLRVIDRAAIEASTARTLTELLSRTAGVQMSATGGRGKTSSVFIRGTENRHAILLVDGVRYGSASAGTPTWETIPVESIERIEVLKGPASALYGSDGVGGVVQVFTRKGRPGFHPHAAVSAGTYGYWSASAGLTGGQGPLTYSASLQRERERGFNATQPYVSPASNYNPDRDPFWNDSLTASLGYQFGGGWSADASVLYSDGVSHFDEGGLGIDRQSALRATVAQFGLQGRITPVWTTELRIGRGSDTANALVARPAAFSAFRTDQTEVKWQNTIDTSVGAVVLGLEQRRQSLDSSTTYPVTERDIDSAFAGLNGTAGAHSWQANVRRDRNTQFGTADTWFAGYGLRLAETWRVHASHGTSFVAPSFNQLYFPGFGNPLLKSERGRNTDVGITWTQGRHEAKLIRFDNRLSDLIVNAGTPVGLRPLNVQKARIEGWTLGYTGRFGATAVRADLELLDPRNLSTGRQLQRRSREQLTLGADHAVGDWRFGGSLLAVSRRFDDTANLRNLPGYATLDLNADWQVARDWSVQAKLNNVTDKAYETAYGYNQPGRAAYLTLRWQPK